MRGNVQAEPLCLRQGHQDEIRWSTAYFDDMPDGESADDMREHAKQLIDRTTKKFDPTTFADRYEGALIALVHGNAEKTAKPPSAGKAKAAASRPAMRKAS